jgi:uncharacterized membrane protein YhiD involved in acid resistance
MFGQSDPIIITWIGVVSSISISLLLGLYVAFIYRAVTPGFTYSISILYTLLYLAMIVSLVMIVISNQIARAFTLVGALAVIRFRTPIKDAKDAAFIFLALAAGMGAGVGLHLVTALGTILIGIFILLIHYSKFGLRAKRETLVKFTVPFDEEENSLYHKEVFQKFLRDHKLINARSLHESGRLELTFLVKPLKTTDMIKFSQALSSIPQIEKVSVIVSEDEELTQNIF